MKNITNTLVLCGLISFTFFCGCSDKNSGSGGHQYKVHVGQSGTLPELIPVSRKHSIGSLLISGNLNGTDIKYIREMGALAELDIQKASIMSGGVSYDNNYGENGFTKNNEIGYGMFSGTSLVKIKLPESVNAIRELAFGACEDLCEITIPDRVKTIGEFAFSGCTSLKTVVLPKELAKIDKGLFYDSAIEELVIPSKVAEIVENSFSNCKMLLRLMVDNNPYYSIIDGGLVHNNTSKLIAYPNKFSKKVKIPDNIETIGAWCFYGCDNIETITMSDNVKVIEEGAFWRCDLSEIVLSNEITRIETQTFSCYGNSFKVLTVPEKVEYIAVGAITDFALEEFHCKAQIPPLWDAMDVYGPYRLDKCVLYVPQGKKEAYSQIDPWNCFKEVREE